MHRIDQYYDLHFAHQPRPTRDLALLQQLLVDAQNLTRTSDSDSDSASDSDSTSTSSPSAASDSAAHARVAMLQREQEAIAHALAEGGPGIVERTLLTTRIDWIAHRYHRHFAGQRRSTRIVHRLVEMVSDLEELRASAQHMALHTPHAQWAAIGTRIDAMITMYQHEQRAITDARAVGNAQHQAGLLGAAANALMATYQQHFPYTPQGLGVHVGQRTEFLRGLIHDLQTIRSGMDALARTDLQWPHHQNNLAIVNNAIAHWQQHVDALTAMRTQATPHAVRNALYEEADLILERYNLLQQRGAADRELRLSELATLCDAIEEVLRQLEALVHMRDEHDESMQSRMAHIHGIRDALVMLVHAYDA